MKHNGERVGEAQQWEHVLGEDRSIVSRSAQEAGSFPKKHELVTPENQSQRLWGFIITLSPRKKIKDQGNAHEGIFSIIKYSILNSINSMSLTVHKKKLH